MEIPEKTGAYPRTATSEADLYRVISFRHRIGPSVRHRCFHRAERHSHRVSRPPSRFRCLLRARVPRSPSVDGHKASHRSKNSAPGNRTARLLPSLHLRRGGHIFSAPRPPNPTTHARILILGVINVALALALTVYSRVARANLATRRRPDQIPPRLGRYAKEIAKKRNSS